MNNMAAIRYRVRLVFCCSWLNLIADQNGREIILNPTEKRSEEHTSELQSLMRISYAVFCLKKKHNLLRLNTLPSSDEGRVVKTGETDKVHMRQPSKNTHHKNPI